MTRPGEGLLKGNRRRIRRPQSMDHSNETKGNEVSLMQTPSIHGYVGVGLTWFWTGSSTDRMIALKNNQPEHPEVEIILCQSTVTTVHYIELKNYFSASHPTNLTGR